MKPAETKAAVAHYVFDRNVSRFTVRAFATGMLSVFGHSPTIAIRDYTGEGDFDPGHPEQASLRVRIRTSSLEVTDDMKSGDRREIESTMNEQVLESSKYPEIAFESTAVSVERPDGGRYQVTVNGNLSLHGVTRSLRVSALVAPNGAMLRAWGEFSILQSDYGIQLVRVAGGALKLKDELRIAFDMVARKQE